MTPSTNEESVHEVTLSFSANMRFVRAVRHFVGALCGLAGYEAEEADAIALVATEILNNSIEHGCDTQDDQVEVRLVVTPELFRFEVVDAGKGGEDFAAHAVERSAHMPQIEEPRGRGLYLIHNFMDELDVTFDPDRGTSVRVAKVRQP